MRLLKILFCLLSMVYGVFGMVCQGQQGKLLGSGETVAFTSKNYPNLYPRNQSCSILLQGEWGTTPSMQCEIFNIPGVQPSCSEGRMKIVELRSKYGGIFCGHKNNLKVNFRDSLVKGWDFLVKFESKSGSGRFSCNVTAVPSVKPTKPAGPSNFKCTCGTKKSRTRIVGGTIAEVHEFPWQVGIVCLNTRDPFCGGSLVTDRHVLTAAHCLITVSPSDIEVSVGDHNVYSQTDNSKKVCVKNFVNHPSYNYVTMDYDYSVITLAEQLQFSPEVSPICLPGNQTEMYTGDICTISGWGAAYEKGPISSLLKKALVRVIDNKACQKVFKSLTSRMICVMAYTADTCDGDSGGPLSCPRNGNYELAGVVSFGWGCARPGIPGVNARTTAVQQWIQQEIEGGVTCPRRSS